MSRKNRMNGNPNLILLDAHGDKSDTLSFGMHFTFFIFFLYYIGFVLFRHYGMKIYGGVEAEL
jgi:hypothetical protein